MIQKILTAIGIVFLMSIWGFLMMFFANIADLTSGESLQITIERI